MQVTLKPQIEAMVRRQVESGRYHSESVVITDALQRMLANEDNRIERLRAAVMEDFEQAERWETIPYTPELMERLKREATDDARAGKPIPDEVRP